MPVQYRNPVWPDYFADPFVLRTGDEYYAYGTGPSGPDERSFPVLRSKDLAKWEFLGGALEPLTNPPACAYWAPEAAERDGNFYLYYSASTTGSDQDQRLRVAVSAHPAGPFRDIGRELLPDIGFSIDPSPFRDPKDGKNYLFYASDHVGDDPTGTGLSVIQLGDDMISTVDEPRVVVRASADWHIYERDRDYKGKKWPAWYCLEGPCCLEHEGKYYCLYSGGCWRGADYGVGFAVADHPLGPWKDTTAEKGPSVLRGIPGQVLGPGHNSVVRGPGDSLFIVYHAWDLAATARRMCIDPLLFMPEGPVAAGPTIGMQTINA
jgi:arabinan endo-1,5-alpha-L-arabinosidase